MVVSAKRIILDSLGCAIAATTLGDACAETLGVMESLGGMPESTILGSGAKVAAPNAAFANGALVHALNYDPNGAGHGHMGCVAFAAPLAAAEANRLSGRDFIASVVAAAEVSMRLTAAVASTPRTAHNPILIGQLLTYPGSAAGAGRAYGLDARAMESAFMLSVMQAAGSRQVVLAGDPPAKAIYAAFPNQVGVTSALLARAGVRAELDAFGPPAGLFSMFYGGSYDAEALVGGLGSAFEAEAVEYKAWPTSGHVVPFIEAAGQLIARGVRAHDVASVEVTCHPDWRPWVEPLAVRRRPDSAAAAGNAIPFCTATVLAHGRLSLGHVTGAGLNDAATLAMAERVAYQLDPSIKGGKVVVTLTSGGRERAHVERASPVSYDQLVAKFRDCCTHAARPLSDRAVTKLITMIETLESLDDVRKLAALAGGAVD
jgi:2-methylcitrate dehydratase PrpD